jgi:glucose/arabinose dehydrogenase
LPTIATVGFGDASQYSWNPIASGFSQPLLVTHAGDGSGRLFVVEQHGMIWVIENGMQLAEPFLDIRFEVGSGGNEQGLLGLAFDPNFASNGYFYVNYTGLGGNTVIARFQVSDNPNIANPDSEAPMLYVAQPYANHNGGHLEFGPDGYLYIGLGDGGSGGDPAGNGQSLETHLGKMLRIDVTQGEPYAIPPDNPFANGGGLPEIWAYGLRNPWRFSFDRATGDLYIADVGQGEWEEIDFLPGGIAGGSNLGWDYFEGTHPYEGTPPDGANFIGPVVEYDHGARCSVTGGYVYRGAALPAWNGVYFYGDFCSGEVMGLYQQADGAWQNEVLWDTSALITSFGLDEAGELYLVDRSGGIYQLQAN